MHSAINGISHHVQWSNASAAALKLFVPTWRIVPNN